MPLSSFSPLTQSRFKARFDRPTAIQEQAWPAIQQGQHVLISAPTGAGKSLAAWLPLLDRLLSQPAGPRAAVRLLYISPLRALSRDMAEGMFDWLEPRADSEANVDSAVMESSGRTIQIAIRTGDTAQSERQRQRRQPPDVLLTTPESLFVMLGSRGGRAMLHGVECVIIDEVHAMMSGKRGVHLAVSLERLEHQVKQPIQRIGLSATARPLESVAGFLGGRDRKVRIVRAPAQQPPRVCLEKPPFPIGHLAGPMHWQFIRERLVDLARRPGTMLVFCNTRALVERVGAMLGEALDPDQVAVHHGSLGIQRRELVERGLKCGRLRVVVCSSSLELGIDVGPLERVCQLGSCGSINAFRQRAGRARHRPDSVGMIHVFPMNLSDLLELDAMQAGLANGALDRLAEPGADEDVLAQQLIAMVASGITSIDELFELLRASWPFRQLDRACLEAVLDMLHEGYVPGRETGQGPLFRVKDQRLAAGPGAERLSLVNGGTIPEWFEYDVVSDQGRSLGRLDEEFAFESAPGQVIGLGGQAWRILRVQTGQVIVEPSDEAAHELPFWFGDGAGRSDELSTRVQLLLEQGRSEQLDLDTWLQGSRQVLGRLPGPRRLVVERFFDPGGDQHLVLHSPHGARLNRAWGLALRKRFCRSFNFELQAAATENGVLISLGAVHSFELSEVVGWLSADQIGHVLTQALLDTPLFQTRLRWCANTALAIARHDLRGRVPAQLQRNQTENLIARIFPDQLACLENLSGERRIPDHPLVRQALRDCLETHMDLTGLTALYRRIEVGQVDVHCVDSTEPSPLAQAMIQAPQHSFLDPAAAEERRTRTFEAVPGRKPVAADQGTTLDLSSRETLARALVRLGYLTPAEGERQRAASAFNCLLRQCEAVVVRPDRNRCLWVARARLADVMAVWPKAAIGPFLARAERPQATVDSQAALVSLLLGRARWLRRLDLNGLASETGLAPERLRDALLQLVAEGVLESHETPQGRVWRERKAGASAGPALV